MSNKKLVLSIDSGTTSNRILIYDIANGNIEAKVQIEIKQHFPKSGWMEECPIEIFESAVSCINKSLEIIENKGMKATDIKCIGITNQRETTIVWDKTTGKPLYNAVIWSDTRTEDLVKKFAGLTPDKTTNGFRSVVGLPISTYFSALKLNWLLYHSNNKQIQQALKQGNLLFGTVDTWLIWKLTNAQMHATDVTNASRTLLLNLQSLQWDPNMCKFFNINQSILPKVLCSSDKFGVLSHPSINKKLHNLPITGVLGDQQASLVGQNCCQAGSIKVTFGTGAFLLINIGGKFSESPSGCLTTVGYKFTGKEAVYAYEGSISVAGAAVNWLCSNLGLMDSVAGDLDSLVTSVPDNGGCYFVPAFTGLLAPHWRPEARGVITGLTQAVTRGHLCRAALEAVCYQVKDILVGQKLSGAVRIDGGLTQSSVFCQMLADICELKVVRPKSVEVTALGAAIAACHGHQLDAKALIDSTNHQACTFQGRMSADQVKLLYDNWLKAVSKSY